MQDDDFYLKWRILAGLLRGDSGALTNIKY
jgi:hypothetical protein